MTAAEFVPITALLSAGLDREFPSHQVEVWFLLLGRFPADAVRAAVLRHLSESSDSFLPPPATIVRLTIEAMSGESESAESAYRRLCEVRLAWGELIHRGDLIARKHLDDRLWNVIESVGGWSMFCGVRECSQQTEFAQFRNAWSKAQEREVMLKVLPPSVRPGGITSQAATLIGATATAFVVGGAGGE
jgi:hypothetical protein